ncbi:hypothetical protein M5689_021853 [Euphorbia peplus]|nr:hypothetical protein M5689_021853 [Euphorbia peplus]
MGLNNPIQTSPQNKGGRPRSTSRKVSQSAEAMQGNEIPSSSNASRSKGRPRKDLQYAASGQKKTGEQPSQIASRQHGGTRRPKRQVASQMPRQQLLSHPSTLQAPTISSSQKSVSQCVQSVPASTYTNFKRASELTG